MPRTRGCWRVTRLYTQPPRRPDMAEALRIDIVSDVV
jgi:hypothetical protein